jgi:hypothetical protein
MCRVARRFQRGAGFNAEARKTLLISSGGFTVLDVPRRQYSSPQTLDSV